MTFKLQAKREAAKSALKQFHNLYPQTFLICGTLLGAIREGDLIHHDRDLDLGCFALPPAKEDDRFKPYKTFHYQGQESERAVIHKRGEVKIDLFVFFEEDESCYYAIYPDEFPERPTIIRRFPKFHLKPLKIWDHTFFVPNNPKQWLEINYGPDWRIPNPKFKYQP